MNQSSPPSLNVSHLLIGNSFPLALIKIPVRIFPLSLQLVRQMLRNAKSVTSYWGHDNTLRSISELLEEDLTPHTPRPSLLIDPFGCPVMGGKAFSHCIVASPVFPTGIRPNSNDQSKILKDLTGWNFRLIDWTKRD